MAADSLKSRGESPSKEIPFAQNAFLFVDGAASSTNYKPGRRHDVRSHIRKQVVQRTQSQRTKVLEEGAQRQYISIAPMEAPQPEAAQLSGPPSRDLSRSPLATLDTSNQEQTTDFLRPSSTRSWITISSPSRSIQGDDLPQEANQTHCALCGAPQIEPRDGNLQVHTRSFKFSPLELLGSGRLDPFLTSHFEEPGQSVHDLVDHAVTCFLPGLIPDINNSPMNPLVEAWLGSSLDYPVLFHALVFAASSHLEHLRNYQFQSNSPSALAHKQVVIQQLNTLLKDPEEAYKDEIILAIVLLSSDPEPERDGNEGNFTPFVSPLRKAQWLDFYGKIRSSNEHMKALDNIIAARGGLENLRLYGLADTIIASDTIYATKHLRKPTSQPSSSTQGWIEHVLNWAEAPNRFQTLHTGFQRLQQYGLTSDAIFIFNAMAATTIAIDHHVQGIPSSLNLGQICKIRIAIQQRLLLLPSAGELQGGPANHSIYEGCRITAMIFSIGVILPIPHSFDTLQVLVKQLKRELLTNVIYGEDFLEGLPLWMLIVGGIAAINKEEGAWYVSALRGYAKKWGVSGWKDVEGTLGSFLWLENACEQSARRLWEKAMWHGD
ncbi:hypothetical protein B0O99DRAFT_739028 [Bisporella sp. PMI_857]|nr:hypothetical protein B0O99DRAFT_739028 [Bisporella sp. PMI_857]